MSEKQKIHLRQGTQDAKQNAVMKNLTISKNYDFESSACHLDNPCYRIRVSVRENLGELMPFLNAGRAPVIQYEPDAEPVMILKIDKFRVALRKNEIAVGPVTDRREGEAALSRVAEFLNETWKNRDNISPDFRARRRPQALEIYKVLPGTNCGECGESACMAFAVKLSLGRVVPGACTFLAGDSGAMHKIQELVSTG